MFLIASPALSSWRPHLYSPPAGLVSACGGAHSQSSFSSEFIRVYPRSVLLFCFCSWVYRVQRQPQQHGGAVVYEQRRRIFHSELHSRPPHCQLCPVPDVHCHLDFTVGPPPTMHCAVARGTAGMDHNAKGIQSPRCCCCSTVLWEQHFHVFLIFMM